MAATATTTTRLTAKLTKLTAPRWSSGRRAGGAYTLAPARGGAGNDLRGAATADVPPLRWRRGSLRPSLGEQPTGLRWEESWEAGAGHVRHDLIQDPAYTRTRYIILSAICDPTLALSTIFVCEACDLRRGVHIN